MPAAYMLHLALSDVGNYNSPKARRAYLFTATCTYFLLDFLVEEDEKEEEI